MLCIGVARSATRKLWVAVFVFEKSRTIVFPSARAGKIFLSRCFIASYFIFVFKG